MNRAVAIAVCLLTAIVLAQAAAPESATATDTSAATQPTAPAAKQPPRQRTGPGAAEYAYQAVSKTYRGKGDTACFIFQPDDPKPAAAPVVIFLHGWRAVDPVIYGGWIKHLVLRGNIVLFPRYQDDVTNPDHYDANVATAVRDAMDYLEKADGVVRPDRTKVAVVGHSCGGILTANYAATAVRNGLPVPRAVMCVEPGKSAYFKLADLTQIPADTLMLTIAGDLDRLVGDGDARRIFSGATTVKKENRNMILMMSDTHGSPGFYAGHLAPLSFDAFIDGRVPPNNPEARSLMTALGKREEHKFEMGIDAVDYFALWRWCDALISAAFTGENREQALGDTPAQRDMGKWSDGVPVKQPTVILAQ